MRSFKLCAVLFLSMTLLSFVNHSSNLPLQSGKIKKWDPAVNTIVPFQQEVFILCANDGAGEIVLLQGELHILTSFNINGNNIRGKFHAQPQGVTGVGEISGDKYQATGVTQEQFKGSLQNGQFETTYINNFRIIGQGADNNYLVHTVVHVTINANGEVTAVVDNFSSECK